MSLAFAEDSLHDFLAFLKLVQVSVSDDLSRLEDEFIAHTVPLGDSQDDQ